MPRKLNSSLSYSSKLFVAAKKRNSFAISQIRTLSQKHRGGVGAFLCETSAFSAPARPSGESLRYHLQPFRRSLVFNNLRIAPPFHRFASPAFSRTYKSLFSQLACFHKHLRCPLVFPFFLATRLPRALSGRGHSSLSVHPTACMVETSSGMSMRISVPCPVWLSISSRKSAPYSTRSRSRTLLKPIPST